MVVIRELPCNLAGSARVKISHSGSEGPGGLVLWGWGCPCFPGRVPGWGRGTARGGCERHSHCLEGRAAWRWLLKASRSPASWLLLGELISSQLPLCPLLCGAVVLDAGVSPNLPQGAGHPPFWMGVSPRSRGFCLNSQSGM